MSRRNSLCYNVLMGSTSAHTSIRLRSDLARRLFDRAIAEHRSTSQMIAVCVESYLSGRGVEGHANRGTESPQVAAGENPLERATDPMRSARNGRFSRGREMTQERRVKRGVGTRLSVPEQVSSPAAPKNSADAQTLSPGVAEESRKSVGRLESIYTATTGSNSCHTCGALNGHQKWCKR